MAFDRVMPFDFITQRKTKLFYNEELTDIHSIMHNKENVLEILKKHFKCEEFDDQEAFDISDVPELNEKVKESNKIVTRNKRHGR